MQAIIKIGSSQYLVEPNQEIIVNRLDTDSKSLVFDNVLLAQDGDTIKIGQPTVVGASVEAEIIEQTKGPKVRVSKFKAKSRYRKNTGFRPKLTKVKVLSVKI
jgi:large subunit ribosomal protein L21